MLQLLFLIISQNFFVCVKFCCIFSVEVNLLICCKGKTLLWQCVLSFTWTISLVVVVVDCYAILKNLYKLEKNIVQKCSNRSRVSIKTSIYDKWSLFWDTLFTYLQLHVPFRQIRFTSLTSKLVCGFHVLLRDLFWHCFVLEQVLNSRFRAKSDVFRTIIVFVRKQLYFGQQEYPYYCF